jgi:hypothetical protein
MVVSVGLGVQGNTVVIVKPVGTDGLADEVTISFDACSFEASIYSSCDSNVFSAASIGSSALVAWSDVRTDCRASSQKRKICEFSFEG